MDQIITELRTLELMLGAVIDERKTVLLAIEMIKSQQQRIEQLEALLKENEKKPQNANVH